MDKAGRIEGRVERDPFATVLAPCPPERLRRWPVGTAVQVSAGALEIPQERKHG